MTFQDFRHYLETRRDDLRALSDDLWSHPELGFEEHHACAKVADLLRQGGHAVTTPYCGLDTAFRAEAGSDGGPVIAFCSEYDALAGLGHACGHNLICACGVAAFEALAAHLPRLGAPAKAVLLGTPAEESLGGKVKMVEAGCLDGIDAVLMAHPGAANSTDSGSSAVIGYEVTFHGRAAHAGGAPEKGINALDAVMLLFSAINAYRQQLPSFARIHGIITKGGDAPNIIPDTAAARIYLRSIDEKWLDELHALFLDMVKGAELMTRTKAELFQFHPLYRARKPNAPFNQFFAECMEAAGQTILRLQAPSPASSDFGNFSQAIPGIHPHFAIVPSGDCPGHTPAFREASHTDFAFDNMLNAAAALAATAWEYLAKPDFRKAVHDDFQTN